MVYKKLEAMGFSNETTVFADCLNVINKDDPKKKQDITSVMHSRWGKTHGALSGFPFGGESGKTSIPADGKMVVLFAPHVGLACNGTLGQLYKREKDNIKHLSAPDLDGLYL